MKLRHLLVVCAAVIAVLAPTAASAPSQGATVVVRDAKGDNKTAPDVTSVTVRQQSKTRVIIEFRIDDDNDALDTGQFLVFFIDKDRNARTGSKDGAEYLFEFEQASPQAQIRIHKYNPKTKKLEYDASFRASFGKRWGGLNAPFNVWRFFFDPTQMGITKSFGFAARSEGTGEDDAYDVDRVPNTGSRIFTLR